eukprot:3923625-Pleurochrysis_carterae.AAC.1
MIEPWVPGFAADYGIRGQIADALKHLEQEGLLASRGKCRFAVRVDEGSHKAVESESELPRRWHSHSPTLQDPHHGQR